MANYVVISKSYHASHGYKPRDSWSFAADDQIVPVLQAELGKVLPHYALAFLRDGEEGYQLVALTGLNTSNLYVAPNGKWLCGYVPAALRAYPFRMAMHEGQHVLCLADEHLVKDGQETPLFKDDGELVDEIANTVNFLEQCEESKLATAVNIAQLAQAGVIEEWPLQVARGEGEEPLRIEGLFQVSEKALAELEPQALHALRGAPLALAYAQLFSTHQLDELTKRSQFLSRVNEQMAQAESADLEQLFGDDDDEISFGF